MNKQSIREIFDDISLSVISFLESHVGVVDVEFNSERQGVAEATLAKWEEENAYKLPDDYKAFLQISDGLSLTWKIKKNDQVYPLGCMHLNRLRDIKQIKEDDFQFGSVGIEYEDSDSEEPDLEEVEETNEDAKEEDAEKPKSSKSKVVAFDMDSRVKDGKLALLYKHIGTGEVDKPQVWFQDLSCKWFFIANTFTDYFRLMIMHLGLPHWQYAFTQVGLDPQTLQWFRFLSPERLAIDMENRK